MKLKDLIKKKAEKKVKKDPIPPVKIPPVLKPNTKPNKILGTTDNNVDADVSIFDKKDAPKKDPNEKGPKADKPRSKLKQTSKSKSTVKPKPTVKKKVREDFLPEGLEPSKKKHYIDFTLFESPAMKKIASEPDTSRKNASELEIGDQVEITGDVNFKEQRGKITSFGKDKRFVVVKLYKGGEHSFHSSDVSELEPSHDEQDLDEADTFYVAFYDETEQRSWIGKISKEHGGKWHESTFKGKADSRWGQSYMAYLKPEDIMTWIHKGYHRGIEIEGPFLDPNEALEHVKQNWGKIEESVNEVKTPEQQLKEIKQLEKLLASMRVKKVAGHAQAEQKRSILAGEKELKRRKAALERAEKPRDKLAEDIEYTKYADWKQAVLLSYPAQSSKIKFRAKMEGEQTTVIASIPGEEKVYGIWDDVIENGQIITELNEAVLSIEKQVNKVASDLLGQEDIEKVTAIPEKVLMGSKEISHKFVDSTSGPWILRLYKGAKAKFVSVQTPKSAGSHITYFKPHHLAFATKETT